MKRNGWGSSYPWWGGQGKASWRWRQLRRNLKATPWARKPQHCVLCPTDSSWVDVLCDRWAAGGLWLCPLMCSLWAGAILRMPEMLKPCLSFWYRAGSLGSHCAGSWHVSTRASMIIRASAGFGWALSLPLSQPWLEVLALPWHQFLSEHSLQA